MLIMKKKITLATYTLIFSLLIASFNVFSTENSLSRQEQLIDQVEFLFTQNAEELNYDDVLVLSNQIIVEREKYPQEIIATTYLLLSYVTSNKGELESAYQFTQDGLASVSGQKKVKLCLQIQLAKILSAKKEYKQLLNIAQQAIATPHDQENIKYILFALSYRSVAFAMLNQYQDALVDLQKVESIIEKNPSFAEHISLLTILANTYYHLADYQTALTMHLKILQLRFRLNKLDNINQTYYHLANTFYRLNRFNDAYNAYWESKKYAEKKSAPIFIAYASQGLGLTLTQQKLYIEAKAELLNAKALFSQSNLSRPYLETITSLILLSSLSEEKQTTTNLLIEAEKLSLTIELADDYIILYQLLADFHNDKDELAKAYFWQKKYSDYLMKQQQKLITNHPLPPKNAVDTTNITNSENILASTQTRQLAVKLTEQSALAISFSKKYHQQKILIIILSSMMFLLLCIVIFFWLKRRAKKLKKAHEAVEKPNDVIATPVQTKQLYEKNFNMARKYTYPLTLSYITITNWQELTFQFNKKIVAEVSREIASVINKHINEFESAGLINDGEFLLIFPHQYKKEVAKVIEKLVLDLKLRFFANLGGFSVIISYSIESPNFQDIDPYIYLSQLSDSIKIA